MEMSAIEFFIKGGQFPTICHLRQENLTYFNKEIFLLSQ